MNNLMESFNRNLVVFHNDLSDVTFNSFAFLHSVDHWFDLSVQFVYSGEMPVFRA